MVPQHKSLVDWLMFEVDKHKLQIGIARRARNQRSEHTADQVEASKNKVFINVKHIIDVVLSCLKKFLKIHLFFRLVLFVTVSIEWLLRHS